jgi:hypothetical protein
MLVKLENSVDLAAKSMSCDNGSQLFLKVNYALSFSK